MLLSFFCLPLRARGERQPTQKLGLVIVLPRERDNLFAHARPCDFCKLLTTHGHARERMIFAPEEGFLLRVFFAPQTCACCAKKRTACHRPVSKTGPTFLGWQERHAGRRAERRLQWTSRSTLSRFLRCWRRDLPNFQREVLQSPPLSLFEHLLSSPWAPIRGWSARSDWCAISISFEID